MSKRLVVPFTSTLKVETFLKVTAALYIYRLSNDPWTHGQIVNSAVTLQQ